MRDNQKNDPSHTSFLQLRKDSILGFIDSPILQSSKKVALIPAQIDTNIHCHLTFCNHSLKVMELCVVMVTTFIADLCLHSQVCLWNQLNVRLYDNYVIMHIQLYNQDLIDATHEACSTRLSG